MTVQHYCHRYYLCYRCYIVIIVGNIVITGNAVIIIVKLNIFNNKSTNIINFKNNIKRNIIMLYQFEKSY